MKTVDVLPQLISHSHERAMAGIVSRGEERPKGTRMFWETTWDALHAQGTRVPWERTDIGVTIGGSQPAIVGRGKGGLWCCWFRRKRRGSAQNSNKGSKGNGISLYIRPSTLSWSVSEDVSLKSLVFW